ncbi:Phosphotransferase KptA/Tpt1 [Desulfosarcina cetonica]|uniref:RNA 2'-phosphotransferase n=1 Tax=Desulfosarcina cetonica TaxID=90730 RepID=UPI0006D2AD9E|nr:RNA 2'-phosphotransferase [Desulfosarcina cetonica]VTR71292.1 Phosphotransferase KptA/Tpt1 [Desulfosarcina cetonica]
MSKHRHQIEKLAKFLTYILGRRPDEFGLVPDERGFVKIKDLLKALDEEAGWRHVRQNHIREVVYTLAPPPLEIDRNLIRAIDRSQLVKAEMAGDIPKLLYHALRRRAYPVALEKGAWPRDTMSYVVLARDRQMAQRLGRRMDSDPIILTVNTAQLRQKGSQLLCFGDHLMLADALPVGSFSGPPLPEPREAPRTTEAAPIPTLPKTPGSYFPDLASAATPAKRNIKRLEKQKNAWKRDRKRQSRSNGKR